MNSPISPSHKQRLAKWHNGANGWEQRLPLAQKRKLRNVIRQLALQESHICRSVANMPAGPENALSWIIREVLAEPQPAAAWVVHIIGIGASDDRDFMITLRDDGIVEDPTQAYQRDGLPGKILMINTNDLILSYLLIIKYLIFSFLALFVFFWCLEVQRQHLLLRKRG